MDGAGAGDAPHPAAVQQGGGDGLAEGSGQVGGALGGVQAAEGQAAAAGGDAGQVDPERGQGRGGGRPRDDGPVGPLPEGPVVEQGPVQGDPDRPGQVVVAGPRGAGPGTAGVARGRQVAGEAVQQRQQAPQAGVGELVDALAAAALDPDQAGRAQPAQGVGERGEEDLER